MIPNEGISFPGPGLSKIEISHTADVDLFTGSSVIQIPLPTTAARSNFHPQLGLNYSSSATNSVFGIGWALEGISFISINLEDGLPKYDQRDNYAFNGNRALAPALEDNGGRWGYRTDETGQYLIRYFKAGHETNFERFEKWTDKNSGRVHWRVRDVNNTISVYGWQDSGNSRICNPADESNVFLWLLEAQYDESGNAIQFHYLPEDGANIPPEHFYEQKRLANPDGFAQKYPVRISYGNTVPLSPDIAIPPANKWLFDIVFDYGNYPDRPYENAAPTQPWQSRPDPFSVYSYGFEIRTYRLCRRILMYHHFDELGVGDSLCKIISFEYNEDISGTTLTSVAITGVRRSLANGTYSERSLPPLMFRYTKPSVEQVFNPVIEDTNENIPQGFNGNKVKWIDLFGEGLPGLLYESNEAWYYKPNLGGGRFGEQGTLISKPAQLSGSYSLGDFDRDGNLNLFTFNGRSAGFYEFDRDQDTWNSYTPFKDLPRESRAQFIDLDANGLPDLVVDRQDKILWYPSKGKSGFGQAIEVAKNHDDGERYATAIGDNLALDYFFADMSGDGLPDQVRINNGRVAYFPNLGNGHFGPAVTMANAPTIDFEEEFDPARIRLYDLDGSGTTDIIYLGRGEIRYWYNASGNQFVEGGRLANLPFIDNLSSVRILDFLGDGTPCLVWSNSIPGHAYSSIHFLRLTNGIKPRLLTTLDNSMGKACIFEYRSSGLFYLQDKDSREPWISKLPTHKTVVSRKVIRDQIANTIFTTLYKYKNGQYDGAERKFAGFGLVEQYDSELFENAAIDHEKDYSAPSCTRIWFHNGLFGWDSRKTRQYYLDDNAQALLPPVQFEELSLLSQEEFEVGYRTLRGRIIRQEIYGVNKEGIRNTHPFQVVQTSYKIRRVQPAIAERDAVFYAYQSERASYDYEEAPDDPRVAHHLTLSADKYGNLEQYGLISYRRRAGVGDTLPGQLRDYITISENKYINRDEDGEYQVGILFESRDWEVNTLPKDNGELVSAHSLVAALDNLIANALPFGQPLSIAGPPRARLIAWSRTFFWNDTFDAALPFGQAGTKAFAHHEVTACFTNAVANDAYGNRVTTAMLEDADKGNYSFLEGFWWQSTPVNHYLPAQNFYQLDRTVRQDNGTTQYEYDPYFLNIVRTTGPEGNETSGLIDHNIIEPYQITDSNDNVAQALFDPLGILVASFSKGSVLDEANAAQPYGSNLLSDYTIQEIPDFDDVLANPGKYLQQANEFFFIDLDSWRRDGLPIRNISLIREEMVHDGKGNTALNSRSRCVISYLDGFGRVLQQKRRAEAGQAIRRLPDGTIELDGLGDPVLAPTESRWLVSGHTVYNNKQEPVRQFEPFFSSISALEGDEILESFGVSTQVYSDAVGRVVRTEMPNGTFTELEIRPWSITDFDLNDTVGRSFYKEVRDILDPTAPEKQALTKALAHQETPSITHLNPMGQAIVEIQKNNDGTERRTENQYDINGNIIGIIDPRTLKAFEYKRDMLGRILYEKSMDAGESWSFHDSFDQTIHTWDGRGVHQQITYDKLGRPTSVRVDGALGLDQVVEKWEYGENAPNAKERNLKGRTFRHFDQAGLSTIDKYDLAGTPLKVLQQFRAQYADEPDWSNTNSIGPGANTYISVYEFDALGRIKTQRLPDTTSRRFLYLQGGGIQQILVSTADGELNDVPILKDNRYNARGQRVETVLGNDVVQNYYYDEETFRMDRIHTIGGGRIYQDIAYTYDPMGNLIYMLDSSQQPDNPSPYVMQGLRVSAHADFEYDALYQLKRTSGRVHQALLQHDYRDRRGEPPPGNWAKGTRHISLNNAAAVERYTRTYEYDEAGNIKTVRHQGDSQNWTRQVWTSNTSNRSLPWNSLNGTPITNREERFDANGNCLYLPHVNRIEWNYRNNISKVTVVDRSADGKPDDVEYYVYGGDGIRVRKVTQRVVDVANDIIEFTEKIYLDGCEIKRIHRGNGDLLKRFSSHISDGNNRLAIIHSWETDSRNRETDDTSKKNIHYQLHNHIGSVALELDENGAVITYEEYFPFGGTAFIAGRSLREINIKDYRYSGKERDDITGLYYFGYRYYAHWIGGWLSPDPIGPEDDVNLYLYVFNNPVNLIDPNGLQATGGQTATQRREFLMPQLRTAAQVQRYWQGRHITVDGERYRIDSVTGVRKLNPEGTQWEGNFQLTHLGTWREFVDAGMSEEEADSIADMMQSIQDSLAPLGQGAGGESSSDGDGEEGGNPNSDGQSQDGQPGSGGSQEGNGQDEEGTSNNQAEGGNNQGRGGGTVGDGPGEGRRGQGNGAAGNQPGGDGASTGGNNGGASNNPGSNSPGAGGNGTGNRGAGSGRTGNGNDSNNTTPGAQGRGGTGRQGQGERGGHPDGSPTGRAGGRPGGTGTADTENLDENAEGSPEGDPNGSPEGVVGGSLEGTLTQDDLQEGQQPGGEGQGGQGQTGHEDQSQEAETSNEGQDQGGQGGGEGQGQRDPTVTGENNWLDTATRWAGYANLEFGGDETGGGPGGIPGGMDLFGWRPPMWVRRTLQVVYIAATVVTTIIPIGKAAIAAKVAIQAALKAGIKATAKRLLTSLAAKIPSRAAIMGGLRAFGGKIKSLGSRIKTFFTRRRIPTISTSATGNPAAIARGLGNLSRRQQSALNQLGETGAEAIVNKKAFGLNDLAALTAETGDEFAMFTSGGRRLLVRGSQTGVPIDISRAQELASKGWRWSAHTHPGGANVLRSSTGDRAILEAFSNSRSAILNSEGRRSLFQAAGDILEGWLPR